MTLVAGPGGELPDGPPLARATWDRAGLRRDDAEWLAAAWQSARVVLVSPRSQVPVDASGAVELRPAADAPDGPRRLLGVVDGTAVFAVTADAAPDERWLTLRDVGTSIDDLSAGLVATAIGLEQWHQRHTHCPRCGAVTVETQAGWTRTCPSDDSVHFPRTDPAVIMLVHDGDRALLGRGPQWGEGRFSTLAGFVEPGETLEGAVAREVYEEVGVTIRDVRYVASQPWPFPASLMLGFMARLDGDPSLTLDPVEMAEAGWFTRDEVQQAASWTDDISEPAVGETRLRAIPPVFSISRFLIDRWLAGEY